MAAIAAVRIGALLSGAAAVAAAGGVLQWLLLILRLRLLLTEFIC